MASQRMEMLKTVWFSSELSIKTKSAEGLSLASTTHKGHELTRKSILYNAQVVTAMVDLRRTP